MRAREVVAVLSMVRSNLYRLTHGGLLWGYLIAYAGMIVFLAVMCWLISSSGPFADVMDSPVDTSYTSSFALYGETFMSGGFAVILATALCGIFFVGDFSTGSIKNLLQIRGGRVSYVLAASITMLLIAAVFIVVGIVVSEVAFRVAGFGPMMVWPPLGELVVWCVQCALLIVAYGQIILFVTLVTRSSAAIIAAVVVVSTGLIEELLRFMCANVFKNLPALRDCLDGYLSAMVTAVGSGPLPGAHIYLVTGATIAVMLVACIAVMCRRDVK